MAPDVVIRAEGLGKKYIIGHQAGRESYVALRDVIARNARNLWRTTADVLKGRPSIEGDELEEFWALRDISFEVERGEVVGVIGRNGAGKSTLLKVLSRITEPTEGRVEIHGRVASLLEVGTGFHPELTGRENIYLNGAILGMTHAEIRRKFDEIVAFAEVERFLDTPVKRYSSGMYVRLAFAVAAHLEPEILIVDEVLAVGDAEFQKKCLGKMGEVAGEGRTVLFVSHNMPAVGSLCKSGILLERGAVVSEGSITNVVSHYGTLSRPNTTPFSPDTLFERDRDTPVNEAGVRSVAMFDQTGKQVSFVESFRPVTFRVVITVIVPSDTLSVVISINNSRGDRIAKFETSPKITPIGLLPGDYTVDCKIDALPLIPGEYSLTVAVARFGSGFIEKLENVAWYSVTYASDRRAQMSRYPEGWLAAAHVWALSDEK